VVHNRHAKITLFYAAVPNNVAVDSEEVMASDVSMNNSDDDDLGEME
jgi:hypothetical protein